MALFRRKSRKPNAVQVHFRKIQPIDPATLSSGGAYSYAWTLPEQPQIGQWVKVRGMDGPTTARIYALGPGPNSGGMELLPVLSVVPEEQVRNAMAKHSKSISNYFDHARKTVGLPIKGRLGATFPDDYPSIPPLKTDSYTADEADHYGRVWWRIHKQAEELSRPSDEVRAYKSAAIAWFKRRDKKTGKS